MPERKITLVLTGWQKRMLKDFMKKPLLPAEVSKISLSVIDRRQWVMYRVVDPIGFKNGAWNLYLTDAQIKKMGPLLGENVNISALRISPEMVKSGAIMFE
jgi:hypothetical protein